MKQVQIQSDEQRNEFLSYDGQKIVGKYESASRSQTIKRNYLLTEKEISVTDYYEDETMKDETEYKIRGSFSLSEHIFDDIINTVDKIFDELEEKDTVKVIATKNLRRIEEKDTVVEITASRIYLRAKDLEIEIKDSESKFLKDEDLDENFYEELTGEDAKNETGLIYIIIIEQLNLLRILPAKALKCLF